MEKKGSKANLQLALVQRSDLLDAGVTGVFSTAPRRFSEIRRIDSRWDMSTMVQAPLAM